MNDKRVDELIKMKLDEEELSYLIMHTVINRHADSEEQTKEILNDLGALLSVLLLGLSPTKEIALKMTDLVSENIQKNKTLIEFTRDEERKKKEQKAKKPTKKKK